MQPLHINDLPREIIILILVDHLCLKYYSECIGVVPQVCRMWRQILSDGPMKPVREAAMEMSQEVDFKSLSDEELIFQTHAITNSPLAKSLCLGLFRWRFKCIKRLEHRSPRPYSLEAIPLCPSLIELSLACSSMLSDLSPLARCKNLRELDLSGCKSTSNIDALGHCRGLGRAAEILCLPPKIHFAFRRAFFLA